MKFKTAEKEFKEVIWGDHWPGCEKCRTVDLDKPSTLAYACAHPGAALLMEELTKRQAPVVAQSRKEVREWARRAGCFKGA